MPVVCTPDALSENVTCLANQDQQTLLAQIVYLLCHLNSMSCDPDTLAEVDSVKCLQNWDQQSLLAAAVYQLCVIAGGGGSGPPPLGAAPEIYTGTANDPNGVVTPNVPTEPAIYFQLLSSGGGGEIWQWQPDTQQWGD